MASSSGGTKKRLVSSLDGEVLERLSMKLNPAMLMKDYQTLGGRFKYTYEYIQNFARERNPTLAMLHHWWSSKKGREKTVSVLIEHLSEMERDDAVDLLRPCEFYNSHEAAEYDENFDNPIINIGNLDLNRNLPPRENEFHQNNAADQADNKVPAAGSQQQLNFPIAAYSNEPLPGRRTTSQHQMTTSQHQMTSALPNGLNSPNIVRMQTPQTMNTPTPYGNQRSSTDSYGPYDTNPYFDFPANNFGQPGRDSGFAVPTRDDSFGVPTRDNGPRREHNMFNLPRPQNLDGSDASSPNPGPNTYPEYLSPYGSGHISDTTMNGPYQYGASYNGLAIPSGHDMTVAADKVALVIGNKDYAHPKLKGLQYPEQDAADVTSLLTQLGFKVVSLINLTHSEMRTAMLAFCCLLGKGVYGVVYFAGHGYEDSGETFLLPIDSDLKYKRDESLRTQEILEAMQQCDTSLNLLIIDACRVSLPNKCGVTVPRIKRNVQGNTVFAYSCCSLQESLEEAMRRNGLYCHHLLRRLRENRRIENILMDVATDFAKIHGLKQRPCIETDCMMDFRLTDPISPEFLPEEFRERCRRWMDANRYPDDFSLDSYSHLKFHLQFHAEFCNTLHVSVTTVKSTLAQVTQFYLDLQTRDPLSCVEETLNECNEQNVIPVQIFKIVNIQKLYKLQEPLILCVHAMYKVEGRVVSYKKNLDLGWPLVSSVMCLWDNWLLGDRCKSTMV